MEKTYEKEVIPNIEAILVHESERYSVLQKQGHVGHIIALDWQIRSSTFVYDVPDEKQCWAEIITTECGNGVRSGEWIKNVVFHLHNTSEIQGAGWNHGKFGSGSTVILPMK